MTTAKSKYAIVDFDHLKAEFLEDVVATVEVEEIPPKLILNWDQTGIRIVTSNLDHGPAGCTRVEIGGAGDKRLITVVFCVSLVGDFLPIYQGITVVASQIQVSTRVEYNTLTKAHWSNKTTMIQYNLLYQPCSRVHWKRHSCHDYHG